MTHVGTNEQNRNAITFLDLIGPTSPQADGYQFTFNGNVVTCPLTPMPFIWGVNVVNSYYGLIQNNDVVNWAGSGVMVDGLSSYNDFNGNFVMRINGTGQRGSGDLGLAGDGFWFGNPNNYVTNNIVTDAATGKARTATDSSSTPSAGRAKSARGYVNIPAYQGADPSQPGQSQSVDMNLMPILAFSGQRGLRGRAHRHELLVDQLRPEPSELSLSRQRRDDRELRHLEPVDHGHLRLPGEQHHHRRLRLPRQCSAAGRAAGGTSGCSSRTTSSAT